MLKSNTQQRCNGERGAIETVAMVAVWTWRDVAWWALRGGRREVERGNNERDQWLGGRGNDGTLQRRWSWTWQWSRNVSWRNVSWRNVSWQDVVGRGVVRRGNNERGQW